MRMVGFEEGTGIGSSLMVGIFLSHNTINTPWNLKGTINQAFGKEGIV